MKCPSCSAELKYTERPKRVCAKCNQPFALEPRENALGMSDLRMRGLVDYVSAQGAHRYTSRQLWHAACRQRLRQAGASRSARIGGVLVLGFFTTVCAVLAGSTARSVSESLPVALAVALIPLAVGLWAITRTVRAWRAPAMPIAQEAFAREILAPWIQHYGPPKGLADAEAIARLRDAQLQPERIRAVLASPDQDVLDCLWLNGLPERLGLATLHADGAYSPAEQAVIAALRARPAPPLLLLHDASAAGCLLPRTLPAALGLGAHHRVRDLGLRPRDVQRHRFLTVGGDAPAELLAMVERHAQAGGGLSPDERAWLRPGRVSPIAAVPPAQLIAVITRAVDRSAPAPGQPRPADPEAQARAFGFLSWPEREGREEG